MAFAPLLEKLAPVIFVLLWSTGYIGAKLGLPYSEPFRFLSVRIVLVLAIMAPVLLFYVRKKSSLAQIGHSMVTGVLVHAIYLGGIFFAISRGMPAGLSALIVALQPLLTSLFAFALLGERLSARKFYCLLAALFGVVLVMSTRITGLGSGEGLTVSNIFYCLISVFSISIGAVYQKRFVQGMDLRSATFFQYVGAIIPWGILALTIESKPIVWSGEFLFALVWLVVVLSIGAVTLLMFLIRRDSASSTASLFYLVPVSTALIAWLLFDETLSAVQILGMLLVIVSVALGTRKAQKN